MNDLAPTAPKTPEKSLIERMSEFAIKDPDLGLFQVSDMGQVFQIAEAMTKSGVMVPKHCAGNMGVCVGITMRALHWGFDPFGLANESFQASDSSPVAFSAKVFTAALRHTTGIDLRYRYEGSVKMSDKPALSAKGNTVARRAAMGDRKCIAYVKIGDDVLEYETPILDHIGIKNSALWHNDPDQQLAYFAGRGWIRRYRSEVILGALSVDEVEDNPGIRDVTPKQTGFAAMAERARLNATKQDPENTVEGQAEEVQHGPSTERDEIATSASPEADEQEQAPVSERDAESGADTAAQPAGGGEPNTDSPAFKAGRAAFKEGFGSDVCPHEDEAKRLEWLAGWNEASNEVDE